MQIEIRRKKNVTLASLFELLLALPGVVSRSFQTKDGAARLTEIQSIQVSDGIETDLEISITIPDSQDQEAQLNQKLIEVSTAIQPLLPKGGITCKVLTSLSQTESMVIKSS